MNFLALEYFLEIERAGSFSAAARKLFVSQQSLSESIQKLEQEVGTALFVRKRPLVLTEAGLRFSQGARAILEIRTGMLRDIAALGERQRHKLTLAVSTFEAPPFLPELLTGFTAVHPEYEIPVVKRQVTDIASHMDGVDLYFSFLPLDPNLEHIRLIEKDRLALAVRQSLLAQHFSGSLSSLRQELAEKGGLALLRQMPFILLYDRKGDEIPLTRQLFRRAGFSRLSAFNRITAI